jgi:hypothetical protein
MRLTIATLLISSGVVSAQSLLGLPLDIGSLLSSLKPASSNDPRFTAFHPPGNDDGALRLCILNLYAALTDILFSSIAMSRPQWYTPCHTIFMTPLISPIALANHNFIHRNGRNMTIPHLIKGLAEGMNMGADFTTAIGGAGLLSSPNPLGGSFDLSDLNMHNFPIEHDASISRQDAALGNDQPFYNPNWQQYIRFFDGKTTTDIPTASKAKFARYNDSLTKNPQFQYGPREAILSYGENALYLQAMSDPVSGKAQISYVKSLFEQEKLPYDLGWRPSKTPITLASLGVMAVKLLGVSPEPLSEGAKILVYVFA